MQKRSKRILAATLAAAGVLAVSGVAYALWSQSDVTDAITGSSSETFEPITVTGTWEGRSLSVVDGSDNNLAPTESGIVQLKVPASASNTMNARITSITGSLAIADPLKSGCAGFMTLGSYAPTTTLAPSAAVYTINLNKAVTLNETAPVGCQGMAFTTTWTVTLDPTRSGPSQSGGSTFALNPTAHAAG